MCYCLAVPHKKQETNKRHILSLPEKDSPDYFRALVQNCIAAYEKFTNDGLSLDYCKVVDQKLRAMVLADAEYSRETKSIYAQQRLEEIEEIENLANLAGGEAGGGESTDIDDSDPRNKMKPKKNKALDKDMLNIRFKAAQLKREIRADISAASRDAERDAAFIMFVPNTRDEIAQGIRAEVSWGNTDDDLDTLAGRKEEMPGGTSGKLRNRGRVREEQKEDSILFEEVLENGAIVEL